MKHPGQSFTFSLALPGSRRRTATKEATIHLPLQIVFREVRRSEAIESAIRDKAGKLDEFFDRIMGCRVTVGIIQKHRHQGKLYI